MTNVNLSIRSLGKTIAIESLCKRVGLVSMKFVLIVVSVSLALLHTQVFGQKIPAPPIGVNGYTIGIKEAWVDSGGFRPVRVTITTNPVKVAVNDERFEILYKSQQYSDSDNVTTTQLVIPAGQKSATVELYVNDSLNPNLQSNLISVFKNGRNLLNQQGRLVTGGTLPPILLIGDELPLAPEVQKVVYRDNVLSVNQTKAKFSSAKPLPNLGTFVTHYEPAIPAIANGAKPAPVPVVNPWTVINDYDSIHYSHPDDLPFSWIGLQSVEQILISFSNLQSLASKNSLQLENLEKWVVAGGILIVYDTGPDFKRADEIWPLLSGSQRKSPQWKAPGVGMKAFEQLIPSRSSNQYYGGSGEFWYDYSEQENWASYNSQGWPTCELASELPTCNDSVKNPLSPPFGVCNYLDGRIVAVNDDMSKWTSDDWRLLHNALATSGLMISSRISSNSPQQYDDGNAFHIPGVGEPPTVTFQFLIGAFLLVAGPVMILILKRTEKMHLLFVLVPLLSLAVCTSLFMYAVVADGSNRWGRASTVTHLDHRSNMAVTHARAMYYTGSNPGGYSMDVDAIGMQFVRNTGRSAQVEFDRGLMNLSGGDIAARTPHEVSSVRPHSTTARLLITPVLESEEEGGEDASLNSEEETPKKLQKKSQSRISKPQKPTKIKVKNLLGAKVNYAVIKVGKKYYAVANLESDASVEVSEVVAIQSAFGAASVMSRKLSPVQRSPWEQGRSDSYSAPADNYWQEGVYGEQIRTEMHLRARKLDRLLEAPNCYVAILEELPMVSSQIEPVNYKLQLHVVRGQW